MTKSSNHGPSKNTGAGGRNPGGGGINQKNHVKTPVRTGNPAKGISPGAVSYLGNKVGNHTEKGGTTGGGFTPWNTNAPTNAAQKLGNQVALNGSGSGARPGGGGRILHGQAGSQSQHGPANPGNPVPTQGGSGPGSMGFPSPGGKR